MNKVIKTNQRKLHYVSIANASDTDLHSHKISRGDLHATGKDHYPIHLFTELGSIHTVETAKNYRALAIKAGLFFPSF